MASVKVGSPEDPTVLVGAVIHQRAFDKIKSYIDYAKQSKSFLLFSYVRSRHENYIWRAHG